MIRPASSRRFIAAVVAAVLIIGCQLLVSPALPVARISLAQSATTSVIVHYHRFDSNYGPMDTTTGWNLWLWPYKPTAGDGAAYAFDGTDAFGEVAHAQVPGTNTEVGIIVRLGNFAAKDVSNDRFIDTPNQQAEVWVVQGIPTIFTSLADAQHAIATAGLPEPVAAWLDASSTAVVQMSKPIDLATAASGFTVTDLDSNSQIPVTGATDLTGKTSGTASTIQVQLASSPDVTHRLQLGGATYLATQVMPRLVLNDPQYTYNGHDLGATYTQKATKFRVWAPLATTVNVLTYKTEAGGGAATHAMKKSTKGTWLLKLKGNWKNRYYLYQVTNFGKTNTAVDPYAKNIAVNGTYGQIVDLPATDPKGWKSDHYVKTGAQTNAVLYEVHVRDFSIDANSGMKHRGKYLAFTETGTKGPGGVKTGVSSLKELGITHVELLPIQGCASLDEIKGGSTNPAPNGDGSRYNWCYDPRNYDAPNGAYATNPHGTTRITEVKKMVQALHKQGLGVVVDVVYNHTSSTDVFDPIVPNYYYRQDYSGNLETVSCCPDLAAERPMVRNFILDSVSYWMKEYHLDGFRFDLMSLLGTKTVAAISKALHKINPSAVILGEPWDLGANIAGDQQLTKGTQKDMKVGVFNDDIRNGLEGNVFSEAQAGYATGKPSLAPIIKTQIVGNVNYASGISGWADKPEEAINYVSSHDNNTLWDRINTDILARSVDDATRIRMDELAQAIVFTSQGTPFMAGGEEMLRTKQNNGNSYTAGDAINEFDWSRKAQYKSVFDYYAGLIHLRLAHPAFRMDSANLITQHLQFMDSTNNSIEFELTGHANKDKWQNIVVIYNPNPDSITANLPAGSWKIVAQAGAVGTKTLGDASGTVSVDGYTMEVLHQ